MSAARIGKTPEAAVTRAAAQALVAAVVAELEAEANGAADAVATGRAVLAVVGAMERRAAPPVRLDHMVEGLAITLGQLAGEAHPDLSPGLLRVAKNLVNTAALEAARTVAAQTAVH